MIDSTVIRDATDAIYGYAMRATQQSVELQMSLFNDWVVLNKNLMAMNPIRDAVRKTGADSRKA